MASNSIGALPVGRNPAHARERNTPHANSADSVIPFDPAAWEMVVRRVTATEMAERRAYLAHVAPIAEAHSKGLATLAEVLAAEKAIAPYGTAHSDAVNDLTTTPAPTLAALKLKIEIAHRDGLFDGSESSDAAIEVILSDLSRLLGDA